MTEAESPVDRRDLDVLRQEPESNAEAKERVRARLAAVIPAMGVGSGVAAGGNGAASGARPANETASGPAPTRLPGSPVKLVAAFLVGGAVGAAIHAGLTREPPARVIYLDRPAATAVESPLPTAVASGVSVPESVSAAAASPSASHSSAPRLRASQLSAERKMLDEARATLMQGDARSALDVIERHRRTFPSPMLGEERDALQVQALVKAGRFDEARSRADAFRKRTPGSLFLPMVDSAIDSIPQ